MSATLTVTHKAIGAEVRRAAYDVVLDGNPVGSVDMNATFEMPIEPGGHSLQVRSGRKSSRTEAFDATDGETIDFRCTGKSFLPIFLASFVVPSLALQLKRVPTRSPDGVRDEASAPALSVMLIVADAAAAVTWYREALGADRLWDLGGVAALELGGAPFLLHEAVPGKPAERCPTDLGSTTTRIEVFLDAPDEFVARAADAGATDVEPVSDHAAPWGIHRQGGFTDPFGHRWSVGDRTPLRRLPS